VLTLDAQRGAAYTVGVFVAGRTLQALLIRDDLTPPPLGSGRVRLILAAGRARQADVDLVSGPVLARHADFATVTGYRAVRAGTWKVAASSTSVRPLRTVASVLLAAGSVTSIVLFDAPLTGLAVRALPDATGAARSPNGPVPAGGDGMASLITGHAAEAPAAVIGSLELLAVFATCAALQAVVATMRRRAAAAHAGRIALRRVAATAAYLAILLVGALAAALAGTNYLGNLAERGTAGVPGPAPIRSDARLPPSAPSRLRIPAIGVDTPLQPLGLLPDDRLQPPSSWQVAGWYAGGVEPGDPGPAVIAGHLDSVSGPAVFYRLRRLRPGDLLMVQRRDRRLLTFIVDTIAVYPKAAFPTAAVYGPTALPTLRLITCAGDFDSYSHSYLDNLVVSGQLRPATQGGEYR
jgi:hypothetical protein